MKAAAIATVLAIVGAIVFLAGGRIIRLRDGPGLDLRAYDYRDTQRIVNLTARAAALVEEEGTKAFEAFRENADEWTLGDHSYLYVYGRDGVNLFHGGYPAFVNRNLIDFTDPLGRKVMRLIIDQLDRHREANPHGWVHYLWVPPRSLDGAWKASCNFPATLPDGRAVIVGSGLEGALPEREFYRIVVDEAAELLAAKGRAALDEIRDPRGPFSLHDRGVFVLEGSGGALIDPGLNLNEPRNLFDYRDFSGRQPLRELEAKLDDANGAWVIMLGPEAAGKKPVKKGIYARRATMDGAKVIVGAICPLPRPAWM